MPIECPILEGVPCEITQCDQCGEFPLVPFMRGTVQRSPWRWWQIRRIGNRRPYCAVICSHCKVIVGWELA